MKIIIYSDGASRGNPGPAGAGAVLKDKNGDLLTEVCDYLGEVTNNQAEYRALLLAVEKAKLLGATELAIHADSELMVKQVLGEYKVKNAGIKPIYQQLTSLLREFSTYTIDYVPRAQNAEADELANVAIDNRQK